MTHNKAFNPTFLPLLRSGKARVNFGVRFQGGCSGINKALEGQPS